MKFLFVLFIIFSLFCFSAGKKHSSHHVTKRQAIVDGEGDGDGPGDAGGDAGRARKGDRVFGDIVIPASYTKMEVPSYNKSKLGQYGIPDDDFKKLEIHVRVLIRSIGDVDELNEEITVEMDFVASWVDTVLYGENIPLFLSESETSLSDDALVKSFRTMDPAFLRYIWKPDLFIENVVSITRPAIIVQPIKVLVSKYGVIVFSTRITVKMDCEMEFHYYPADTQKCDFNIRSYSHTQQELSLFWSEPVGVFVSDRDEHNFDIQVSKQQKFNITEEESLIGESYKEVYDVLQFTILARRSLSYHMIQTYLPSIFFIVITWLCFLIPVTMVEARIGIAMTTLLTLTSMFSSVRENTPIVSYIKAIDIWMVACIFFVFSTLLEFTLLVFMRHADHEEEDTDDVKKDKNEIELEQMEMPMLPKQRVDMDDELDGFFIRLRKLRKRKEKKNISRSKVLLKRKEQALSLEQYAFLMFFLTFLGFNLIYWPWLLIQSDYFNWTVDEKFNQI